MLLNNMDKNLNESPTHYRLELKERACASDLKTNEMCNSCKRNINLDEELLYEYWVEPLLVKNFKDKSTRCSSFLKEK
jgi:hypothetical protein